MADAPIYIIFLLLVGIIYGALRLRLGPGRYGAIAESLVGGLLCTLLFGGMLLLSFGDFDSPSPMNAVVVIGTLCFTLGGLWLLWLSGCALWSWRRALAEVDDDGVSLWALFYRRVPWVDIATVTDFRGGDGEIAGSIVVFADGLRHRSIFWPVRVRRAPVGWRHHPAAATLIRSHPNYREKATAA